MSYICDGKIASNKNFNVLLTNRIRLHMLVEFAL